MRLVGVGIRSWPGNTFYLQPSKPQRIANSSPSTQTQWIECPGGCIDGGSHWDAAPHSGLVVNASWNRNNAPPWNAIATTLRRCFSCPGNGAVHPHKGFPRCAVQSRVSSLSDVLDRL